MLKIAEKRPLALPPPKGRSRSELLAEGVLTFALYCAITAWLSRPGDNPLAPGVLAWVISHGIVRGAVIGSGALSRTAKRWR